MASGIFDVFVLKIGVANGKALLNKSA